MEITEKEACFFFLPLLMFRMFEYVTIYFEEWHIVVLFWYQTNENTVTNHYL
jgi:hypothetical protein